MTRSKKNDRGKTTLLIELVEELTRRGVRVGTIKHSSHSHELDTPGKDSFRHRQAGATPAASHPRRDRPADVRVL